MASPTVGKLAHFVVQTSNLDAVADWYLKVTNSRPVFRSARACFMTFDQEHHRIGVLHVEGLARRSDKEAGVNHIGLAFNTLGELMDKYEALKQDGITPQVCTNHGPSTSFYYFDPDGNRVELLIDNFETFEEAQGFVESDAYRTNPMGIRIDPDLMLRRFREGAPAARLIAYEPIT